MDSAHLSSRPKRFGRLFVVGRQPEKLRHINSKPSSQPVKQVDTCAEILALNVADGCAIDVGINGQRLLAQPFEGSDTAQIPGDAGSTLHGPQAINLRTIKPSDISDIIAVCCRTSNVGAFVRLVGALVRHATILAVILGGASAAGAQENPDPLHVLDSYEGWWAFGGAPEACEIQGPDSGKVAIGRYQMGDDGPIFGQGTPKLGTWDATCELHQPEFVDGQIEAVSICTSEEGGQVVGRTRFLGSESAIEVQSPIGRFELARCEPTSIDGIERPLELSLGNPVDKQGVAQLDPASSFEVDDPVINSESINGLPMAEAELPSNVSEHSLAEQLDATIKVRPTTSGTPTPLMSEGQRNAVAAIYQQYCDPSFYASWGWQEGDVDQAYVEPYRNALIVRYGSNCENYFFREVVGILALRILDSGLILPNGPSQLDDRGAMAAGLYYFLTSDQEISRCSADLGTFFAERYADAPGRLFSLATELDRQGLSKGYASGLGHWISAKSQYGQMACQTVAVLLIGLDNMLAETTNILWQE